MRITRTRWRTSRACVVAVAVTSSLVHVACACSAEGCFDLVKISGTLERPGSQLRLQIVACRNDSCGEATLGTDDPGASHGSAATDIHLDQGTFECRLTRKPAACAPGQTCGGAGKFELECSLTGVDLGDEEEDTYSLRVVDTDSGATLVDVTQTVTYSENTSNSALCGRDCYHAEIDF